MPRSCNLQQPKKHKAWYPRCSGGLAPSPWADWTTYWLPGSFCSDSGPIRAGAWSILPCLPRQQTTQAACGGSLSHLLTAVVGFLGRWGKADRAPAWIGAPLLQKDLDGKWPRVWGIDLHCPCGTELRATSSAVPSLIWIYRGCLQMNNTHNKYLVLPGRSHEKA